MVDCPPAGTLQSPWNLVGTFAVGQLCSPAVSLPSGWRQWTCCRGGGYGLWPFYIVVCCKRTPGVGLWFLLQVLLPGVGRFSGPRCPRGCYFIQCEGASSPKTFASVNVIKGSVASLSSCTHSANWCGSPGMGGWVFSTQCCNVLAYAKVFCGCFMQ